MAIVNDAIVPSELRVLQDIQKEDLQIELNVETNTCNRIPTYILNAKISCTAVRELCCQETLDH
jgi:hypothetical protein